MAVGTGRAWLWAAFLGAPFLGGCAQAVVLDDAIATPFPCSVAVPLAAPAAAPAGLEQPAGDDSAPVYPVVIMAETPAAAPSAPAPELPHPQAAGH